METSPSPSPSPDEGRRIHDDVRPIKARLRFTSRDRELKVLRHTITEIIIATSSRALPRTAMTINSDAGGGIAGAAPIALSNVGESDGDSVGDALKEKGGVDARKELVGAGNAD